MLERIVRLLGEACRPIVVVAAADQELPALRREVIVARDRRAARGPLEGLAAGLAALPEEVDAAFATSCDVPLLVPAFARRMCELLGECSIAVPVSGGFHHPLSAVYRRGLIDVIDELLRAGESRPGFLFDVVSTRRVDERELADVDPGLLSLKNVNQPADYLAALAEAGYVAPAELVERLGQPR